MQKKHKDNIKTVILLLAIVIGTGMIESIPWWSFVVPVLALGVVITIRKWKTSFFLMGFLSGFLAWFGASLYYHASFNGTVFNRFGEAPKMALLVVSGLIGGILTGLALYTGKAIVFDKTAEVKL